MKKNFKALSVVGIAALLVGSAAVLASCDGDGTSTTSLGGGNTSTTTSQGGGQTEKLSLSVSGPSSQSEWLTTTLAAFNTKRVEEGKEEVEFEVLAYEEDKVDSTITDWATGPDVYAYASDKIQNLFQVGALAELPDESVAMIEDTMTEASLDAASYAGRVLSYPYAGDNGYFLYYNKSLVSEEDCATIEGLAAAAKEKGLQVGYPLSEAFYSAGALMTFGAGYTMEVDGTGAVSKIEGTFDTEQGILGGKAVYQMLKNDGIADVTSSNTPAPTAQNGLVAVVSGSWNAQTYELALGENYAATKLPTITVDGQTKNLSSYLGYKLYGVNPQRSQGDATRLALAHEVATYLVSEEVQESRFDAFSIAPTNEVVAAMDKVTSNIAVKAISAQAEFAVPQTAVPPKIWDAPVTFTAGIKDGSITLENIAEAMATLNDTIEQVA